MGVSGPILLRLQNQTQPPQHLPSLPGPHDDAVRTIAFQHSCRLDNHYQDYKRCRLDTSHPLIDYGFS